MNTKMPAKLKIHYKQEHIAYSHTLGLRNFQTAWYHLERMHILAQLYPMEHTATHWRMLQFGIQIKSRTEIIGQIPRLIFGGVKSFIGRVPLGNTGGANVPALKSIPIPLDLNKILKDSQQ